MGRDNIEQQLLDYFSGNLPESARKAIEQWVKASPENKDLFKKFRKNFLDMRWGMRGRLIQGRFQHLERRLHRRRWIRAYAAAASVLILFGCGFWFAFQPKDTGLPLPASQETILPGSPHAMLILSDGRQISMDSLDQILQEQNGTSIHINPKGQIRYTAGQEKQDLLFNKVIVPRGGEFSITLSDGTNIWLNSESELEFPIHFPAQGTRHVALKGEGYFEVAKDSKRPFVVTIDSASVRAYGTSFDVNNYTTGKVEAILVEGSIGIQAGQQETPIRPGEKATLNTRSGEIKVETVDAYSYIAWKDGNFVFNNEPLESIMEKVARWYNVEVFFSRDAAREIRFSGDIKRYSDVNSLLYFFEQTSDIKINIKNHCLVIE